MWTSKEQLSKKCEQLQELIEQRLRRFANRLTCAVSEYSSEHYQRLRRFANRLTCAVAEYSSQHYPSRQTEQKSSRSGNLGAPLLPGILNEITLDNITPKLPWTTLHVLSSVSRGWREAIQSRQVYDARVRAHSTETLVCVTGSQLLLADFHVVALYSMREETCHALPGIPLVNGRSRWLCKCVSLDGKIYVLGGLEDWGNSDALASAKVYVFDVARQRPWKQCASMREGRSGFGCSVIDGKIYVCGGTSLGRPVCGSEVYDPKINTWSPITPMKSWRFCHKAATAGEELFVFGGYFFDKSVEWGPDVAPDNPLDHIRWALSLEVYHRSKDEWRVVEDFERLDGGGSLFMDRGRFYCMTSLGIDIFDFDGLSWRNRHTNSFAAIRPPDSVSRHEVYHTLSVKGEVLAIGGEKNGIILDRPFLVHSKGFNRESNEIAWQKSTCLFPIDIGEYSEMFPIQL